jgi:hypothetical protein
MTIHILVTNVLTVISICERFIIKVLIPFKDTQLLSIISNLSQKSKASLFSIQLSVSNETNCIYYMVII